jgi:hypothetical protein
MKNQKILMTTFKHGKPTGIGIIRIIDPNDIPRITRKRGN